MEHYAPAVAAILIGVPINWKFGYNPLLCAMMCMGLCMVFQHIF
jgi:hypothetical protein